MKQPNCGEPAVPRESGSVKSICGLLLTIALAGLAFVRLSGCATYHADWEAKCGPQVDPLLKPCSCMDPRTLSCPPPPSDATRKDGGAPDGPMSLAMIASPPAGAFLGVIDGKEQWLSGDLTTVATASPLLAGLATAIPYPWADGGWVRVRGGALFRASKTIGWQLIGIDPAFYSANQGDR